MQEQILYKLVASTLQKMVDDGVKIKNVSIKTGLSSSTLYKFMRQDTVFPRFHTIMAVLEYLGLIIIIKHKGDTNGVRPKYFQDEAATNRRNVPLVRDIPESSIETEVH